MDAPKVKIEAKGSVKKAVEKTSQKDQKPPVEPKKSPPKKYYVVEGKTITSLFGILSAGQEVNAKMFSGGNESLQELVKNGYVE